MKVKKVKGGSINTAFMSIGLLLLLNACSSVTTTGASASAEKDAAMGRSSIVTMGSASLDPAKPSTLSWIDAVDVIGQREGLSNENIQQQVQGIIQNQIMGKGYPLLSANGDFQLHVTLVLAGKNDGHTLLHEAGGIDPGLMGSNQAAGKGSLVIELRQGRALRWRGAVQIYILPEADPVIISRRIEHAVAQLLLTWP